MYMNSTQQSSKMTQTTGESTEGRRADWIDLSGHESLTPPLTVVTENSAEDSSSESSQEEECSENELQNEEREEEEAIGSVSYMIGITGIERVTSICSQAWSSKKTTVGLKLIAVKKRGFMFSTNVIPFWISHATRTPTASDGPFVFTVLSSIMRIVELWIRQRTETGKKYSKFPPNWKCRVLWHWATSSSSPSLHRCSTL